MPEPRPPRQNVGSRSRRDTARPPRRNVSSPARGEAGASALGFVANLATDVKDAALGIPAGIYETGKAVSLDLADEIKSGGRDHDFDRTAKIAKAIGKTYAETYGPLTRGDVGEFAVRLYEHPLGPLLDAATVATGGGAAAVKAGQVAGKAGLVSSTGRLANLGRAESIQLRSPRAIVEDEGPVISGRPLSRNPVIRGRQKLVDLGLKALPASTPGVGEIARYGRELERAPRREALRLRHQAARYQKLAERLTTEETAALHLLARGVHPDDYLALLEREGNAGGSMAKVLANPKVRELVENPSAKLRAAHREGSALSELMAAEKSSRGLLDPEAAEARVGLHGRMVEGARFKARTLDQWAPESPYALAGRNVKDLATGDTAKVVSVNRQAGTARVRYYDQSAQRYSEHDRELSQLRLVNERQGGFVEDAAPGVTPRELPLAPFYVPDRAAVQTVSAAKAGGGVGVPRTPGSAKRNEGVLFRTGSLEITKDALAPEWFAMVKFGLHEDLHDALLASAVRLERGRPLPKGYQYLRRSASERIGTIERTAGERERSLSELIPEGEDSILSEGFATRNAAEAVEQDGYRLIVPEALAKQVAGEFTRGGKLLRGFLASTSVWRAIVLGTRPAFLVNNLVGNALLYAIRNAGPAGIRAYLNAVRTAKGPAAVERLLRDPKTRDVITPEWIEDVFPEQAQAATFGATQGVVAGIRNPRLRRGTRAVGAGIIPATQAVAEGTFRRAGVEAALRRSPEVKAMAKRMEDQTARLEDIARAAIEQNPELQRRISQEVNDMLGDYLSMSPFVRNVLRPLFPFVSWYRAILGITGRLVLDHPGRANLLANLGRVGQELNPQWTEMPSYLEGAINVGAAEDGLQPILTTQAMNPYATLPALGRAGAAALTGKPGELGRAFDDLGNPLLTALIEQGTGRSLYSGAPVKGWGGPVVGATRSVVESLPPVVLATAGPTALYPRRSRLSEALAQSGAPVKRLSLSEARRRAREGR